MRLTVETGPLAGTIVPLDRDRQFVLGSGADCAIRVQEAGVEDHHAVVKALRDQGFGIKALAPGMRVNGKTTEATALHDGDVIELGTTRIAFGQLQQRGRPQIAGYRILGELGKGGMGMVFRAEQVSLHREVALKVLSAELTRDPSFVARFVAEARAAAKLQHANVVQVFDVEHDGDTYYYAMELMRDGSLEDWLKQHGTMPVDRALQVIADAAAGLAYAESLGIVHRDIKPDNLMLDQHGTVKIADLGLARTDADADEEQAAGTPHFMAPEQVLRKPLDHRADLYALGCTFYRLVTGRTPFRGQTKKDILRAQVKDEAEPAHKVNPAVPVEVSAIIQKLMAKDPAARFQSANDLLVVLRELLAPKAKKGLWIGVAAAAALVAAAAIWWAVNKPKEQTIVEMYRDNPEAARLATENAELKARAREDAATIALLETRLSGARGNELASALDAMAREHAGTKAAGSATALAQQARAEEQQRTAAAARQQQVLQQAIDGLTKDVDAALAQSDYARALARLQQPAPAELSDRAAHASATDAQRNRIRDAARAHLLRLRQAVEQAEHRQQPDALAAAIEPLAAALAEGSGLPGELLVDRGAELAFVEQARKTVQTLRQRGLEAAWQGYHQALATDSGVLAALRLADFAGGANRLDAFAAGAEGAPAAAHARALAAALRHADAFATAFAAAAAEGKLQFPGDNATQPVARWLRDRGQLVLLDTSKKPPREQPLATATLRPEQWLALAEQVPNPTPGGVECFVGLLAVAAHADAGQEYLMRLRRDDDDSGTGKQGYPLGSVVFEQLLRRLPEADAGDWCKALRLELRAGLRFAAGLRALSERRNLAGATHLDKLLGELPHSLLVAVCP